MSGSRSQRKGRRAELELTKYLQERGYPVQVGMPVNHGTTPDIIGLPFIHSEVKHVEQLNVPEALKQSARDAKKFNDGMPAVFHKRNYEPWLATMYLDDFLEIFDYYVEGKSKEE